MGGEMLGVMLVLALGGLVFPIALLLGAVLVDLVVLAWAAVSTWHDRLWPKLVSAADRTMHLPAVRAHP